jgi:tetratricopeptide (TPR) repeat protein
MIFLFFIFTTELLSQSYLFKVLTISGKVDYSLSSGQSWKKVQTGESLNRDYKIRLDKNSYTALMYNDGRTMEIQDEGIFEIKDLEQNIINLKRSVSQKFANFVAQEIITDKSEKKDMKTFAAVVRVRPNHIESAIPSSTALLDSIINFSWHSYPSSRKYIIGILGSAKTTIFMDIVDDSIYTLDASKLNLNYETVYKWYVFDADNPQIISDTNSVILKSLGNKSAILDTLELLENEFQSNETPLNRLSLGTFYERNNLNIEALIEFNKAVSLAPESEEYKLFFAKFLLRHKLYLRASELLEDKLNE